MIQKPPLNPYQPSSISMLPLIHPTDKLIITKSTKFNLEDIVVFEQNKILKAHRILYISKNFIIAKGDNNNKADKKINTTQILGVVSQIKRNKNTITLNHIYLGQSLKYFEVIESLIKKFDKNKISYSFLKGLPIHLYYKKSPPKHLYYDLDILISKKDLNKTKKILTNIEFKLSNNSKFLTEKSPTQLNFYKADKPINLYIDLHTSPGFGFTKSIHINSLLPNQNTITNYLLKNTQKADINQNKINILNKETQVIVLLLHFFHHNFKQIQKLHTIKYINNDKLNWNKIISNSKKLNLIPYISPALLLFNYYYPNIVPKKILKNLRNSKTKFLFHSHKNSVFNNQSQITAGIHRFILILFLSQKSLLNKLQIILSKKTFQNFYKVSRSFFSSSIKNLFKSSIA